MNAKIADFGIVRCFALDETQGSTSKIEGAYGYMPPEVLQGNISVKSDVYSFGVLVLEIVCNTPALSILISVVTFVTALEAELGQARAPIQDLEIERKSSSKKKVEHFLRKLSDKRTEWRRREHEKVIFSLVLGIIVMRKLGYNSASAGPPPFVLP